MVIVAILLPTKGRPLQMKERVSAMLLQPVPQGVSRLLYLAVDEADKETVQAAMDITGLYDDVFIIFRKPGTTAVEGWNRAYFYAAQKGRADWFITGADDLIWRGGWLHEALRVAQTTGAQVIGFADGYTKLNETTRATHFMVSRRFCERVLQGFIPEEYRSWRFDREICERAIALGLYAPAYDALLEHTHPQVGKAETDDTYAEAMVNYDADLQVLRKRQKAGFAADRKRWDGA